MSATDKGEHRGFPFVRAGNGVVVALGEYEQEVLGTLIGDLRDLLMADEHETLRRLKPPARPDDADAEADYRAMVDDDLLRSRLELLETVEDGISGGILDDEGVAAWMQSLNTMRLILGERLSLEGIDLASHDLDDGPASFLYEWIGELLEFLVRAAAPSLPAGDD